MNPSLFEPVDIYCERLEPGAWMEPLNTITNAAFLIAAFLLFKKWRSGARGAYDILALIILIAVIGVGSASFHLLANRLTMLADVIPIGVFLLAYLWIFLRRITPLTTLKRAILLVIFGASIALMHYVPPEWSFNGSIGYLPAFVAIFLLTEYLRKQGRDVKEMEWGITLFAASLAFRTIDDSICEHLAIGTHFIWHMLNAAVLYAFVHRLMRA